MKRFLPMLLSVLTVLVILAGCYKDKGNYSYQRINDITIKTSADTFSILLFDTLKITPSLSAPDTNRLRFEWRVYPVADPANPLGMGQILVISRDKRLKERISLKATTGYYNLDLVAIDTVTGVSYFKNLYLQVRTSFQTGWMLLEQKETNCDISFIGPDNTVYRNIYANENPNNPLPLTTYRLNSCATQSLLGTLNLVYFNGGGYILDNTTLAMAGNYSKLFFSAPTIVRPGDMTRPSVYAWGPYTFNDGKVYALNALYASSFFAAPFTQPDALGYDAAPYVAHGLSFGGIFFDQKNYRFLYDGGGTSTTLKKFPANNTMAFDMNNVQKTLITMKPGLGTSLAPSNYWALFKNTDDNNCFLYSVNPGGNLTTSPVAASQQPILNSPNVHLSPEYLFSTTIKQMYYASGNLLYVYDMAANQSRVVYTFATGENITSMQMQNNVITVATYNGNKGGGAVYYLPISSTGDISGNTYTQKFTGFEKIVHLVFKVG